MAGSGTERVCGTQSTAGWGGGEDPGSIRRDQEFSAVKRGSAAGDGGNLDPRLGFGTQAGEGHYRTGPGPDAPCPAG